MQRFDFICYHNTDDGYKIDDFSLFAKVLSRTDETVTFQRYLKFGTLEHLKPVTVSVEAFSRYYQPITNELHQKILEIEHEKRVHL